MEDRTVLFRLAPEEALVLFEFLDRHHRSGEADIAHLSESRVLRLLHGQLNGRTPDPLGAEYRTLLDQARQELVQYDQQPQTSPAHNLPIS